MLVVSLVGERLTINLNNFLPCVCAYSLSQVQLFETLWTVACQAPLSTEFSRQEYWSRCHFLLQGTFLTQGSNLHLWHLPHWQADSLPPHHLVRFRDINAP